MARDVAAELAEANRHVLIAPAGHGKTRALADAVGSAGGRQLALTHTHAGIRSLRRHLAIAGVGSGAVSLETIAGFARRWAGTYPQISGWVETGPVPVWDGIYSAAAAVLDRPQLIEALVRSYDGLFVDEYQDCTTDQHALVLHLANHLPTRLLGDPLQGIFDFGGQQLIDFDDAVFPEFERLPDLDVPWRWRQSNAALGEELLQIRDDLLTYGETDLAQYRTIRRINPHPAAPVTTCRGVAEQGGSAVAIRAQPSQAHALARMLGGEFVSMEEAEGKAVIEAAQAIESAAGPARVTALLDVMADCTTKVVPALATARQRFAAGEIPSVPKGKNASAVAALVALAETDALQPLAPAIRELCAYPDAVVYRPEVPSDLIEAARLHALDRHPSLVEAAVGVRERARRFGRQLAQRTVSRTLLVKGLEFDHAIVFDSDSQNFKHLYVALTRGSRSVTVML
jgi:hypothetical protein